MAVALDHGLGGTRTGRSNPAKPSGHRPDPYWRRTPWCPPRRGPTMASLVCRVCPSTSILSFLSRMAVRTDEFQASGEDGLCVVVEGRDVVAVRALDDLQPGGRQR